MKLNYLKTLSLQAVEQLRHISTEGTHAMRQSRCAVLEVSKYCLKTSDMVDRLGCLINRRLYRLRLLSVAGVFNSYFSQSVLDRIDTTLSAGDEYTQDGVPCVYQWDGDRYGLTRLGNCFFN